MFEYAHATALITGASSGIGEAFAIALARRGMNLILVARTKPKLDELAKRLMREYGIQVTVIEADLAERSAPERLHAHAAELGLRVDLLVNSAGFSLSGLMSYGTGEYSGLILKGDKLVQDLPVFQQTKLELVIIQQDWLANGTGEARSAYPGAMSQRNGTVLRRRHTRRSIAM